MSEYQKQANDFCKETGTKIQIEYIGKAFPNWDEKELHDTYNITITRNNNTINFIFTESLYKTQRHEKPTNYDILATLEKYDPYTFEDFCLNFGYNEDSRKALEIYLSVQKQYNDVIRLFSDVMEELQKID